jgi:hypothetical protein
MTGIFQKEFGCSPEKVTLKNVAARKEMAVVSEGKQPS